MVGPFRSNWKSLALLMLVLSVVAVVLTLLVSERYTKQISLSVMPTQSELLNELDVAPMVPDQAGSLAQNFLLDGSLGPMDVNAVYSNVTQQVTVSLQAGKKTSIDRVGPKAVERVESGFQEMYERSLDAGLEAEMAVLENELKAEREALVQVEQQIREAGEGEGTAARLDGLENERAARISEIALRKTKQEQLEQAQKDLPRLASEPVSVTLASEAEVTQPRPLGIRIALAVLAAFGLATLLTVVRVVLDEDEESLPA